MTAEQKRDYQRAYREKNREQLREKIRARYSAKREQYLAMWKKWRDANPDKIKVYNKGKRRRNREKINANSRRTAKYRWQREKANRATNPAAKEAYNRRRREWLERNPQVRVRRALSKRVYKALRGIAASPGTLEMLGCTREFLREYLEVKFKHGMTWDNYGSIWHVDHIRPCASFDLSRTEEARKCFHFTNLQPLFAEENRKKNAKWEAA